MATVDYVMLCSPRSHVRWPTMYTTSHMTGRGSITNKSGKAKLSACEYVEDYIVVVANIMMKTCTLSS